MARARPKRGQKPPSHSASTSATPSPATTPAATQPVQPTIKQIDARPFLEREESGFKLPTTESVAPILANIWMTVECSFGEWFSALAMYFMIFGGCCSNVFALEAIIKAAPASGHLITFCQFLLVAIEGLWYHFDPTQKMLLKPNTIPLQRWLIQIALFFSVSLLNNQAFNYNISVPVHIILRSGGSMTTMLIGLLCGKRYSRQQVFSVFILTGGCILAALGDSKGNNKTEALTRFSTGLVLLFIAQMLSAIMGLYIEATYAKYGNNYREGLFYTHALSLILFIPFFSQLRDQWNTLAASPPLESNPYIPSFITNIPQQLVFLALNAFTQYICISGVNRLGARVSALSVTVVLNVRKLVSLGLSIFLFGNRLSTEVAMGAAIVTIGGFWYALESNKQNRPRGKTKSQ
ncbi:UAA-domain-containing protein [Ascodesmis nigricans]|uniref:UAA-domain-containing protein n=1 Tax=Ascodesmis nigricans TaxID=341454 RepID=A0A4S2MKC9_9PEZI|nr:UAA-domain-containing protein [Ascodesmis nigricans]